MASSINMRRPLCLIEHTSEGELELRQDALQVLSDIHQPMVVVCIVGLYRTGKSYLMNKLAGKKKGFSIGSTVQSHTKGIWMWCIPHPQKSKHTLVLLDTEGLGDIEGDSKNENWIVSLAMLLSSTFVYNSMGTIDQGAMEQLYYVTELSKRIKGKSSRSSAAINEEDDFFPTFIWTVRDFTLDLELNNKPITEDEYLENALQLIKGNSAKVSKLNLPRECIRKSFPVRKCFVFDRPAKKEKLKKLGDLQEEDFEPDFIQQTNVFCQYVFKKCQTKTIQNGHHVTGKVLAKLAVAFVDAIHSGTVPCIENTVQALACVENSEAVQAAITYYEKQMNEPGRLPTATRKDFIDLCEDCKRDAMRIFKKRSFMDEDHKYQEKLKGLLKMKTKEFCRENEQISKERNRNLLKLIFVPIEKKISEGFYSKPNGFVLYQKEQKNLKTKYMKIPGKGLKADEALREFLNSKESVGESILQMDLMLTAREEEIAAERARAEAIKKAMKRKAEMAARAQQRFLEEQRRQEEEVRELNRRREMERWKQQQKNERRMREELQAQEARQREEARRVEEQLLAERERLEQQAQEDRQREEAMSVDQQLLVELERIHQQIFRPLQNDCALM